MTLTERREGLKNQILQAQEQSRRLQEHLNRLEGAVMLLNELIDIEAQAQAPVDSSDLVPQEDPDGARRPA